MATTGFWPVKSRLKEVIDYADNPDKTTERKYLDDDLAAALEYAESDSKTDRKMHVSGINCLTEKAYEQMTATKQRYGKLGGNVAYHGFQSFRTGEVTPEEAHQIGIETARRMWGLNYEIVVTTHLNTDNLHNHMVVNSVSFRTGRKFENHISDHYKLREISDAICREHGKSVLENSSFYGGEKSAYWVHKNGGMTHREILKADIEECLKYSKTAYDFENRLMSLGYEFKRKGAQYAHTSVTAKGWKRPIRLDSLGYTDEVLNSRLEKNREDRYFFVLQNEHPRYRARQLPLLQLEKQLEKEIQYSHDTAVVLVDIVFLIILQMLNLARDNTAREKGYQPLSPSIRMELSKLNQIQNEYKLLAENNIHSAEELVSFMGEKQETIAVLEKEQQAIRNKNRRPKSDEERSSLNAQARAISAKLKPLRKELATAKSITERYPHLQELLQTERAMETRTLNKIRERNLER